MMTWLRSMRTLLRHHWLDEADARRAVPPDLAERLMQRVAASERRHSGQIRICVEAGLPWRDLWPHVRYGLLLPRVIRGRAVAMFGKLGVWDTERNNGVLIYLLLAEHAIELVADRGLNQHVSPAEWQAMAQRMGAAFREGRFEDGLTQALEEVSAVLVAHFPADGTLLPTGGEDNELPDAPFLV